MNITLRPHLYLTKWITDTRLCLTISFVRNLRYMDLVGIILQFYGEK